MEGYAGRAQRTSHPYETLTPRQRELLTLVAEGNTNAAIAAELFISQRTVAVVATSGGAR